MAESAPFKQCTLCGAVWQDLSDLVLDPEVEVHGYQAHFTDPGQGLVMVTHHAEGCGTTLAIRAYKLRDLYDGPAFEERLTGTAACEALCLDSNLLTTCSADCDMAWMREAIQWLLRHELPPHLAHR